MNWKHTGINPLNKKTPIANFSLVDRWFSRYLLVVMETLTQPTDKLVRATHPFTESGLGLPSFKFIGIAKIPAPSLGEANPTAYMNALHALPKDLKNGCGSCAHCGTAIMNIFIIRNAAGEKYGVGCDCIEKSGDQPLVRASHLAKLQADKAARRAKREAGYAARQAEVVDAATGETREQLQKRLNDQYRAAETAREAAELEKRKLVSAILAPYGEMMRDGQGGFRDSVGQDMQSGRIPTGRAAEIAAEIIGKQYGRRGTKAYWAAAETFCLALETATAIA